VKVCVTFCVQERDREREKEIEGIDNNVPSSHCDMTLTGTTMRARFAMDLLESIAERNVAACCVCVCVCVYSQNEMCKREE